MRFFHVYDSELPVSYDFQFSLHEIPVGGNEGDEHGHSPCSFQFSLHEIHIVEAIMALRGYDNFQFSLHEIPRARRSMKPSTAKPFNSPFMRFAVSGTLPTLDVYIFQFSLHEIRGRLGGRAVVSTGFQFSLHEILEVEVAPITPTPAPFNSPFMRFQLSGTIPSAEHAFNSPFMRFARGSAVIIAVLASFQFSLHEILCPHYRRARRSW